MRSMKHGVWLALLAACGPGLNSMNAEEASSELPWDAAGPPALDLTVIGDAAPGEVVTLELTLPQPINEVRAGPTRGTEREVPFFESLTMKRRDLKSQSVHLRLRISPRRIPVVMAISTMVCISGYLTNKAQASIKLSRSSSLRNRVLPFGSLSFLTLSAGFFSIQPNSFTVKPSAALKEAT